MTADFPNQPHSPQKSPDQTPSSAQPEAGTRDADTEATRSSSPTNPRMSDKSEATPEEA